MRVPANSIEIAIWVAVGGRGTLVGPLLGAALVLQHEDLRTIEVPEQAGELKVVEAAAEGVERRVATRRHATPARHALAKGERRAQALDGIAQQH